MSNRCQSVGKLAQASASHFGRPLGRGGRPRADTAARQPRNDGVHSLKGVEVDYHELDFKECARAAERATEEAVSIRTRPAAWRTAGRASRSVHCAASHRGRAADLSEAEAPPTSCVSKRAEGLDDSAQERVAECLPPPLRRRWRHPPACPLRRRRAQTSLRCVRTGLRSVKLGCRASAVPSLACCLRTLHGQIAVRLCADRLSGAGRWSARPG